MVRLGVYFAPVLLFLAACEDEGNEGNDSLVTGFSGVVIVVILAFILWRIFAKRRNGGG